MAEGGANQVPPASEQRGNNLKGLNDFCLEPKAVIVVFASEFTQQR